MKKIILVASVLAVLAGGISAASLPPYQLPIATTSTLGGLKPDGTTITVDSSTGVASVVGGSGSGSGTVTSASVVTANGLAGTVANPTTTPAITISTTVTGIAKGNGTALSAATSGTDYAPGTSANATGIVKSTTGSGALTTAVAGDFPMLNQSTTGNAATVTTNANLTGDVTSNGNSTAVALVGGATAANVATATTAANAATNANTASTIVKRDGSGNFSAGTIAAALTGTASGNLTPGSNLSDVSSVATSRTNLAIDQRTAYAADTDQTITSASRYVVTTTAFTASRTYTLPAASALNAGEPLLIKDSGAINGANTLIVARAGSDTIDGNTSFTIPVAYGALGLRSNGTNGWEVDANLTLAGATCSAGSYVSAITSTGGVTCTAIPTATSSVLGLVKPDNTTLTNTAGAISCTTGTTSQLGCLKPDGVIITDVAGTITVPKASSSVFGVAEVDNVTITATAGVLTAIGGAATTVTAGTTSVSGTCTSGYNLYNNAGVIGCQANSGGGGIVVGTTTISSGTSGKIEYNNAGVVGELTAPSGAIVGTTDTQTLTNKSIAGSEINSGTVAVANGGTGLSSTPANGALNIGNGSGFTQTTLTAGSNITVTNGAGSITIASTGGGSGAPAIQPAFQTGQYYTMFGARSDGAFLPSANRLYAVPFSNQTGSSVTFTKAAINVTTLASSTACEIGLYTDSSGLPGTLISDIGNVVTTTTGQKTISSLSLAVPSGLSWLVVGCNGAPQISGMTNTNNGPFTSFVGYTDGNLTGNQQMYAAWTYSVGGLPGTFPTAVYNSGAGQPLVWIGK